MIRPSISRISPRTSPTASVFILPALAVILSLALAFAPRLIPAQQQQSSSGPSYIQQQQQQLASQQDAIFRGRGDTAGDHEDPGMRERRLKAMNAQRQKTMVEDTDKLLKLTSELDAEVGSSNPHALNPDQLRRVAEIEKLAKSIREKMSDAVGPTPRSMEPPNMMGDKAPFAY